MTETVTLEVPADLARQARAVAGRTDRRFEDVLLDWLRRSGGDAPVETLSDQELLTLCDAHMTPTGQEELSELLSANREGELTEASRGRLNDLLQEYRRGLVRKAQALKAAVARGLRPPLT
jgi:hypothetical protein